jgi:hypothetical protein
MHVLTHRDNEERGMKRDDRTSGNVLSRRKRGRKPKRTIQTFYRLVAEVEAEVAKLMKKNPKLKKPPVRQAIANCLRHDAATLPHSWWWKDDVPLGLDSAKALFYEAKAAIKKHGPVEPSSYESLSELGERAKRSVQTKPSRTVEQVLEKIVTYKRWVYEQKQAILPSTFAAYTRDCRREELKIIAGLKHIANKIHTLLAKDAPKHTPEKVGHVRDVLKALDSQIADFEASVGKFGAA